MFNVYRLFRVCTCLMNDYDNNGRNLKVVSRETANVAYGKIHMETLYNRK